MTAAASVVIVAIGFFAAGVLHRVTGIGFALVATPIAAVVLGVDAALVAVAPAAILSSAITLVQTRRDFRMRQCLPFVVLVVIVSALVTYVSAGLAAGYGEIFAGIAAAVAAGLAAGGPRVRTVFSGRLIAGLTTGTLVGLAGLGGPPAAVHGVAAGWGRALVPNLQVLFIATSAVIIAFRGALAGPPRLDVLAGAACAVLLGSLVGGRVAPRLSPRAATRAVLIVAFLGAVAVVVQGVALAVGAGH